MKYAIINQNGDTEIRMDSYELSEGSVPLTDVEYDELLSGKSVLVNGVVIINQTT